MSENQFSPAFSVAFDAVSSGGVVIGPCEWPVDYAQCGPCDALDELTPEQRAKFESMAAEYLWRFTNEQFGLCPTTIRPCRQDCWEGISTYGRVPGDFNSPWRPVLVSGNWYNIGCAGGCGDNCGCSWTPDLVFDQPVYAVTEVRIDGVVLDPSAYEVNDWVKLTRLDGGQWPYCQNMNRPLGQPDTWSVTVQTGSPVPVGGQIAAGLLACELAKAACGDKSCSLPQRWQTVTRQGVTISAAIDSYEDISAGHTGIWMIDSWVASVTRVVPRVSIASPDYHGVGRRTTWRA